MFCEYMLTIKLTCYCFVGDSNRIISHASINIYKLIIAHIVKVRPFKDILIGIRIHCQLLFL